MSDIDEKLQKAELRCMILRIAHDLSIDPIYSNEEAAKDLMELLDYFDMS